MEKIVVLDRVSERHPDITPNDATDAWNHTLVSRPRLDRDPPEYVAIGIDRRGRFLELVVIDAKTCWVIKHAQTPPQESIRRELGFGRQKRC